MGRDWQRPSHGRHARGANGGSKPQARLQARRCTFFFLGVLSPPSLDLRGSCFDVASSRPSLRCLAIALVWFELAFLNMFCITSNLRSRVSMPVSLTRFLNSVIVISTASSAPPEEVPDLE